MPRIIKSASSIEEQKLDILPNPKKVNPTVTESHEDSHSNNSKLSVKASFLGSPDISSGIDKLFEVMGLYDKSKTLIIWTLLLCMWYWKCLLVRENQGKGLPITAGPEFGATLCGNNLIINKSLYGLKTSAARFHEHLAELLLRLGFKKTKHDPDLWMIDKASHYEYLATYVDDILIWSKDPMSVIKSLEKIYLKNIGIPEY
jgi:hypothetical protein